MTEDFGSSAEGADTQSAADWAALAERRGEAFAEALYGILALHGPLDLDTRERLELGHFLCLATTDWIRARHLAKATTAPEAGSVGTEPGTGEVDQLRESDGDEWFHDSDMGAR